jgi:2,3-bisphosphoglycerate-independent phosphoglycerate mutase
MATRKLSDLTAGPERILLVFLDGVGLGEPDPTHNPFSVAESPTLQRLLGGLRLTNEVGADGGYERPGVALRQLDATLGVSGRPQSGTGQTALLTGTNAAQHLGRHFGPWVHTALRPTLSTHGILLRLRSSGHAVCFANAYPRRHVLSQRLLARRPTAMPLAAGFAGVLENDEMALREGRALASSITTEKWRAYVDPEAPLITPFEAGVNLARIADLSRFTLFAHYDTDTAGHSGVMANAVAAVERVDTFLDGLLTHLSRDTLLLITSDHGNLEDLSTSSHTLNQVPLLAVGADVETTTRGLRSLVDVAPYILETLGAA